MNESRKFHLPDFLTEEQIQQAHKIYKEALAVGQLPAARIAKEVIGPNMAEINRKLGQQNDVYYLAYACEFVFNESRRPTATERN